MHIASPTGAPFPTNLSPPPPSGTYPRAHAFSHSLQALPPPSLPSTLALNPASAPQAAPSPAVGQPVLAPTSAPPNFQNGPVPASNITAPSPSPSGMRFLSTYLYFTSRGGVGFHLITM